MLKFAAKINPEAGKTSSRIVSIPDETERHRELAYWALESLDEINPRKAPEKPRALIEIQSMDAEKKSKLPEKFWFQTEVYNYTSTLLEVKNENQANKTWLYQIFEWLPNEDEKNRGKVRDIINQFEIAEHDLHVDEFRYGLNH